MMFCPKCGKEAAEGNSFCPVCGAALTADQQPAAAPQQKALPYNVLSIIGIVLSCVSLALDMYTGLTVGLAGLVVSIIALVQCRKKAVRGTTLAIIGIVCGGLSTIYPFL